MQMQASKLTANASSTAARLKKLLSKGSKQQNVSPTLSLGGEADDGGSGSEYEEESTPALGDKYANEIGYDVSDGYNKEKKRSPDYDWSPNSEERAAMTEMVSAVDDQWEIRVNCMDYLNRPKVYEKYKKFMEEHEEKLPVPLDVSCVEKFKISSDQTALLRLEEANHYVELKLSNNGRPTYFRCVERTPSIFSWKS